MTEQGGSLVPVTVSTDAPIGGPALRVVGYTSQPAGRPVVGGAALPVYVVSAAQVAAGYPVAGNVPVPMVLASAVGQTVTQGCRPQPVYVVDGSLDPTPPDPLDVFRDLLLTNATRAYWGPDATWSAGAPVAWPCVVTGLDAAPAGSGTTLGALNGVPCPVLNGSGRYQTAAFASSVAQPYALVAVHYLSATGAFATVHDGISSVARAAGIYTSANPPLWRVSAGATITSGSAVARTALVTRTVFNGASSEGYVNGAVALSGNAGANALTGLTIGAFFDGTLGFIGSIALVAIFHGTNYAARAATIESAARTLIGV